MRELQAIERPLPRQSAYLGDVTDRLRRRLRADRTIFLIIGLYTVCCFLLLFLLDARHFLSHHLYFRQWPAMFLFLMPLTALAADLYMVARRYRARWRLVLWLYFSPGRIAHLFGGFMLLMGMMIFQGSFTSIKNSLPELWGGFPFDAVQANIDAMLHFGTDPWIWLRETIASDLLTRIIEWNYNALWFMVCFGALFFVATSPRADRFRVRYMLCFMIVWVIVGNILAGAFLSAGPAFHGFVTGDLQRFADQLEFLARSEGLPHAAVNYHAYLWRVHEGGHAGFASGISAFPSVHVGLITLNALFLWEHDRRLGYAAFAYVGFVLMSSVYLAWHYAIDGYVAIAVTVAIHLLIRRLMRGA